MIWRSPELLKLYHVRLISYNSHICAKTRKPSFPLVESSLLPCRLNDKSLTEHDIICAGREWADTPLIAFVLQNTKLFKMRQQMSIRQCCRIYSELQIANWY
jgi:hypothetical protein